MIRKRAQPSPDLFSSEDESEPTLRDVMKALCAVTTRVTATEKKLSASPNLHLRLLPTTESVTRSTLPPESERIQPRDILPPAALGMLHGVQERVRARLADKLTGAPAVYLPTTDEDSSQDEPPRVPGLRKSNGELLILLWFIGSHGPWIHLLPVSPSGHIRPALQHGFCG